MRIPALVVVVLAPLAACGTGFPDAIDAGGNPDTDGGGGDVAPTVLPFAVDDWYGPSGYMGDGENVGAIMDAQACLPSRPSTWIGNCHRYTWTPSGTAWAGVYWQYPDGNWGDQPGLTIPAGATQIAFQAWGATGTEKVDFMVGMMAVDGFEVKQAEIVLTTTPTRYTLPLAGASYARVVGGFGWVAKEATAPMTFGIDDIRWE
jgi:hypothetical protein